MIYYFYCFLFALFAKDTLVNNLEVQRSFNLKEFVLEECITYQLCHEDDARLMS